MKTGIPQLKLPPTEPMNVDAVTFSHGIPPVTVNARFTNVVVTGLSTFFTDYIFADPNDQ